MPAVKMKAKAIATCKKDGSYPHVSQNSNKISKSTVVRVTNELVNLAISSQTSQNDFCKNEEYSMDLDNKGDMGQPSLSFNGCTDSMEQTDISFNGCTDSVVARDSLSSSLSPDSEAILPYNGLNYAHCQQFETVNREQFTWEPQLDDNFFSTFQMFDLDSAYETGFPIDGLTLFDDSQSYYNLSDLLFPGTNFTIHGTEENMEYPTLKETIGAADFTFGGSSIGFQQTSDSSWVNHLMCHQAIPFTEELSVISSEISSDRVDYWDQETFIKGVLELADDANSLPALLINETSKRKKVTLVLDLDETLIHSSMGQCDGAADFTFKMITDRELTVYVRKRPFLQEFLVKVSEMFEIIIFTASKRMYAETLLDVLDPDKKFFSRRVYRESCTWKDRRCVKDLTVLGIDLAKVCIIDNTPEVFRFQVNNGIPIKSWFDDPTDSALMSLLPFLEKLVDVDDVRPLIAEKFGART
ncbi:hypothetical protein AAZX31_04G120200 [Glycine max]|uniref:FCP1 homology domain-containing protein n=3 Tax=Glycine subgen. Soja TaxID=1462606 RepID=K7KJU9_SOYBN|nr:uncharacterized protein LOC100810756 [Glycine max]XP_014630142.1 uncharacterized protein LOC100810756 [Glycine max]XP_028228712.1 uncharacterized protein LOC114409447 [Glycine soja]XP_028228713.1 uncharacterized protein LOC114409447 [Glycine soja]KAG5034897.1 hypothetical protein JHK87_009807 [Glycine soja]KAG5049105.1 hypothetical protein JHK85_010208 [Glycine max]KAG5066208.1 hypothetical protein JHK86_009939 [Glycine max]KAH1111165.1 hypothetical protein GYH30_009790 [Glycine max]KAH1|eukprot:XP_003523928.1 uncharacterized protein LOC100810756 [Glycine max]